MRLAARRHGHKNGSELHQGARRGMARRIKRRARRRRSRSRRARAPAPLDWGVGIGGGLWTTGEHLCLTSGARAQLCALAAGRSVLELGSGTGLVGLFLAALLHRARASPRCVHVTDRADHVPIMRENVARNALLLRAPASPSAPAGGVVAGECEWGREAYPELEGGAPFDLVIGTDVAYSPELHAPLITTLRAVCGAATVVLLGVTRSDTPPSFFAALGRAGFGYHLISAQGDFGLFRVAREGPFWCSPCV